MKLNLIKISILLNVIFGMLIYILNDNYFYGDAQNFLNYDTLFDILDIRSIDKFNICDSSTISKVNTFFISTIYDIKNSPIFINLFLIFTLYFIIKKSGIIKYYYLSKDKKSTLLNFLISLLILYPPFLIRFSEPSREYIIFTILFILGILIAKNNSIYLIATTLLIAIVSRPIFTPIYLLWIFILINIRELKLSKILKFITSLILIIGLLIIIKENNFIGNYCSGITKNFNIFTENYQGNPNISDNILLRSMLNIFGDINSFATDRYNVFTRIFYFFTYISRILIIIISYKLFGYKTIIYFMATAITIAIFLDFPHPRYFEPSIFLFIGYQSQLLVNNYAKDNKF